MHLPFVIGLCGVCVCAGVVVIQYARMRSYTYSGRALLRVTGSHCKAPMYAMESRHEARGQSMLPFLSPLMLCRVRHSFRSNWRLLKTLLCIYDGRYRLHDEIDSLSDRDRDANLAHII